jgi:hypothetical protein
MRHESKGNFTKVHYYSCQYTVITSRLSKFIIAAKDADKNGVQLG